MDEFEELELAMVFVVKPLSTHNICRRPTGNEQGTNRFYNLASGRVVHRLHWTCVPMPEGVEDSIHKLAKKEAMTGELNFEDEDYDTVYVPDPIDPLGHPLSIQLMVQD